MKGFRAELSGALCTAFQQLPSDVSLRQIACHGSRLCGVAAGFKAFCATVSHDTKLQWMPIAKPLRMVAVTRDELWGVVPEGLENNYRIVWTPANGTEDWRMLSPLMNAWWVATDGSTVCEVCQSGGYLECTLDRNKSYDRIFDRTVVLTEVGVVNGMIYGLRKDGRPYIYGSSEFPTSTDPFRSITSDGEVMCAISKTTSSAQCTSKAQDKWIDIGGNLNQICMCDRQLYGVAADGTLWTKRIELPSTASRTPQVSATKQRADITSSSRSSTPSLAPAPTQNQSPPNRHAIVITLATIAVLIAMAALFALRIRSKHQKSTKQANNEAPYNTLDGSTEPSAPTDSDDTAPSHHTPLDAWMQDLALLTWRIPRRQLRFGDAASRGAFGIVFRGWLDGQLVAIKVLAPDRCHDMTEIEKFAHEAQFLSVLQHERIVRFMGVAWNAPSDLCIITEFVTGGDLRALLQRYLCEGRPQGFNADKIKIALHIAHALTYLHSLDAPVVHRDLKSKNVLLTDTGDAKLTDFGVAREWESASATMTAGVGSLLWMAPEVMQGERYDEKADIFSFGVVLSELDSNELPYAHASATRRSSVGAAGEAAEHPRRLPEAAICQLVSLGQLSVSFSAHVSPELVALGMACVSMHPTQRPTASEVLGTLHQMWMAVSDSDLNSHLSGENSQTRGS